MCDEPVDVDPRSARRGVGIPARRLRHVRHRPAIHLLPGQRPVQIGLRGVVGRRPATRPGRAGRLRPASSGSGRWPASLSRNGPIAPGSGGRCRRAAHRAGTSPTAPPGHGRRATAARKYVLVSHRSTAPDGSPRRDQAGAVASPYTETAAHRARSKAAAAPRRPARPLGSGGRTQPVRGGGGHHDTSTLSTRGGFNALRPRSARRFRRGRARVDARRSAIPVRRRFTHP